MGDFSLDYRSSDDEEKDRLLREFLGGSQPKPATESDAPDAAPKPPVNLGSAQDLGASAAPPPQTRLEATGRAAQSEGPDELQQALQQRALASLQPHDGQQQRAMASGPTPDVGIAPAAALILDAFVNHGRGAGQIVGATANSIDADRRAEQTRLDHLAAIEANHKDKDPFGALINYGNLQDRTKELNEVKLRRVEQAAATQRANYQPDSAEAKGKSQTVYDQAGNRTRAQLDVKDELNDRTGTDRADVLAKGAQAIADVKHGNAPRTSQDKAADIEITTPATAERSGAEAQARLPAQKELQKNQFDLTHPGAGSTVPIPGSAIDNEAVFAPFRANTAQLQKITDAVGGAQDLDLALKEMQRIRGATGVQMLKSGDKTEYETHYGRAIGALTKLYQSGVLNEGEWERYKEQLPTLNPHVSDATDWLGELVGEPKKDTVTDQLSGMQRATRGLATSHLRSFGIHPTYDGESAKAVAPSAPDAASALPADEAPFEQTELPGGSDRLPTTSNKPPAIPKSAGGATKRTIHFADGTSESQVLTEAQVQKILSLEPGARAD